MQDGGLERGRVRRRRVFYIPGYDPIHPRRYRELYRREGAVQARLSGYDLALAPKRGGGPYGWHVTGRIEGAEVEAEVEVLVWSDLVRRSMGQSIPATYGQLLVTAWAYIGSGALFRLMRLRKGPMIAALYPIGMLLLQLGLAVLAGRLAGGLLLWALGSFGFVTVAARWLGLGLAWALGIGIAGFVLYRCRQADNRFFAYYLMHDYAYSARSGGANPRELELRMAQFGRAIAGALAGDWDEVLVVGHSSGAHLAVSILADLVRAGVVPAGMGPAGTGPGQGQDAAEQEAAGRGAAGRGAGAAAGPAGPALSFLSLGQVVPMVSFLPGARRLRGDLRYLSARPELTWVDVTAPGDGCAFALCDPVAVSGVAPPDKRWPLVLTAAFSRTLTPARWKALRWRFFRLHFQYLCAFDNLAGRPDDYDYFRITAGPRTLAARFAGRAPSKSRIETPVNRHTDCA